MDQGNDGKTMKQSSEDEDVYSQCKVFVLSDIRKASKTFLMEVKERFLKEPEKFTGLRLLLRGFSDRRIDVGSLKEEITKLLAGHDDLILKFNAFLPQDDDEDEDETTVEEDRDCDVGVDKLVAAMKFMNNLRIRFKNDDEHVAEFIQIMKQIPEGQQLDKLKNKLATLFHNHGDLIEEFNRLLSEDFTSSYSDDIRKIKKQKQIIESIQELDISKCEQVSPSYWLLPKNYRMSLARHKSGMDAQVLNDSIVCVNQDSGNYSCNRNHRKQDEIMFKVEDDRFEFDMLMEYVISATQRVKKLVYKNQNQNNSESCFIEIGKHLSVSDLRCIERLYEDYGLDMIEYLHRNPEVALPLVLNRLQKKQADLIERRSDFDNIWVQVCADNQFKSSQEDLSNLERIEKDLMAKSNDHFKEKEERTHPVTPEISNFL